MMRIRHLIGKLPKRPLMLARLSQATPFQWNVQTDAKPVEWHRDGTVVFATPELSAKDISYLVRHRSLEELLPLLTTLVSQDRVELAEKMIAAIQRSYRDEWLNHTDVSIANSFLRSYLSKGKLADATRWKEFIFARTAVKPDALTYSILFKFLLGKVETTMAVEEIRQLHDELANNDKICIKKVLQLEYLSKSEGQQLQQILKIPQIVATSPLSMIPLEEGLSEQLLADGGESKSLGFARRNLTVGDSPIPDVSVIKSKSDGISFLRDALGILCENPGTNLYAIQEKLEKDCYQATSQRLQKDIEDYQKATKNSVFSSSLKKLILQWQGLLVKYIGSALHDPIPTPSGKGNIPPAPSSALLYSALLSPLEVDKIAFIVLQELAKSSSYDANMGGAPVSRISTAIGINLEREMFAHQIGRFEFLQHTELKASNLEKIFKNRGIFERTMREQYATLDKNVEALRSGWIPRWSAKLKAEIGVFLLSIAIDKLKFDGQLAFTHRIVHYDGDRLGVITPCEPLLRLLSTEGASLFIDPWALPMLVPPRPWLGSNSGGYLTQRSCCVRIKDDPVHYAIIQQADKSGSLQNILYGLDVLGRTAWRINEKILTVALSLWNSGVNVATLEGGRSSSPNTEITSLAFKKKEEFPSHEEYIKYVKEAKHRKEAMAKAHSTMCDTNYKLEIARQFVGVPFYLPHSVDFRGRAYPIPPHLSHIGSDLSRGLLVFSEGVPLGERGLRWLKIQMANMAGFDKASRDERVAYADAHRDDIIDSAENPLTGRQWWRGTDEPWQCLATCMELTAAWRSPDPTQFISHLPCQQDGSCNGLQHYAALGRDVDGATQVNLAPGTRPADVYAAVAKLVSEQVDKDAETAEDLTVKTIAQKLVGKINRKIIKQPVMTNVYGVTMYGARQQIEDRLKEYKIVPPEDYGEARKYIARLVFKSLGTLFDRAQQIQRWLTETALEISRAVPHEVALKMGYSQSRGRRGASSAEVGRGLASSDGPPTESDTCDPSNRYPQTSVCWTTPLGFQILQPYSRQKTIQLRTVLQSLSLRVSSKFDQVDIGKQASAFPPNFVHSLDATHMFKTALACAEAGLVFASVHDCFWTHAASVDQMNQLLREQFVDMHQQPVLERLREEFLQRYRGYLVPENLHKSDTADGDGKLKVGRWRAVNIKPLPPRGDFDIRQVLESDYFFS